MATLIVPGDEQVTVGGHATGLKRNSVPLSSYAVGSVPLVGDGRLVSYSSLYHNQFAVAACVNKLARQVSRLPLKPYKKTSEGRQRLPGTSMLQRLLSRPYPRAGSLHFKWAIMANALVQGNALAYKRRYEVGGPVVETIPLAYSKLRPELDSFGNVEVWECTQEGLPRWLDPGDILHFSFGGLDTAIGVSPLQQLGVTLSIEDAAQRHQQAQLRNGARPPSAVQASNEFLGLDPAERQVLLAQLRADLTALYAGPENQGRPALLPPGLTWEKVGHTAVEAELINQRKLTREEVCAVYDVPPPLIGILEFATLANVAEAHRMLYTTILAPWLIMIEETLQAQLIDEEPTLRGDIYVEFDLSEVLKGDLLQRAQALALQISHGVLTIDEARTIENRPTFELPETERPLYPANNLVPVGTPREPAPPPGDDDVAAAATAVVNMDHDDLRRLLMTTGSTVDAVLKVASQQEKTLA